MVSVVGGTEVADPKFHKSDIFVRFKIVFRLFPFFPPLSLQVAKSFDVQTTKLISLPRSALLQTTIVKLPLSSFSRIPPSPFSPLPTRSLTAVKNPAAAHFPLLGQRRSFYDGSDIEKKIPPITSIRDARSSIASITRRYGTIAKGRTIGHNF